MSITDSLLVSVFGFAIVFAVLIALSFLVKLQSFVVGRIMKYIETSAASKSAGDIADIAATEVSGFSAGELLLTGVDEKTAAMIMAIVSDESEIPLNELRFKSIKALN